MVAAAVAQTPVSRGAALAVRGVNHHFDLDGTALPVLDSIDLEVCLLYTSTLPTILLV